MVMDTIEFWLSGHEFEQALGDGQGHGSLVCCSLWGRKELHMAERLNNNYSCSIRTDSVLSIQVMHVAGSQLLLISS